MKITKCSLPAYLKAVNAKLDDPANRQLLQFGTTAPVAGQTRLRDDVGMTCTKATVLQSAQNLYTVTAGRDAFAKKMTNFSARMDAPSTGFEAVSDVKTVGSIDVTIVALSTSLIPFFAVDRGMSMPTDTIWYNDLIALNAKDQIAAKDVVSGNFTPPNSKVNLGPWGHAEAEAATLTVAADDKNIIPGTVKVVVTVGGVAYTGKDYDGVGQILFPVAASVTGATVDYDTGAISVAATGATKIVADWKRDVAADNSGNSVLQVAPDWKAVTLETEADNIIMKDNLINRAYMNKAQLLATAGAKGMSGADILFARTKDAYIEYLNRKVIFQLLDGINAAGDVSLDLSGYTVANYAQTKNDLLLQFITNAAATFLGTTGIGCTSILTSTYGVALLSCVPGVWTPNPDNTQGLNGLAGYFQGIAVYRHNYMDYRSAAGDAMFIFSAKLPDNNSGSCVYGEFLPITHTGVVSNFDMPQNISAGLFSMTGAKKVADNLVLSGVVKLPTGVSGQPYPTATAGLFGAGKINA